jgi:hypothetical protein
MSSRRTPQPHPNRCVNREGSTLEGGIPMRTRIITLAAVAALSSGAVACTQAETDQAEADAAVAADQAGDVAAQAGEVIESGAMKAAQAVESGAGAAANTLERNQAEAAAEGRPGAVDPATDQRVPAN